MLQPEDDLFHDHQGELTWNESAWFGFNVPERAMTGFIYFYHRPNMGYTVGGVAVWDDTAAENHTCLFYDWGEPYATPDGAQMYEFTLPNSLSVHCVEPLRSFEFTYRGNDTNWYEGMGLELDLRFDGVKEPHETPLPPGQEEWADRGHYEQPGRIRGTIDLHGETIQIDCWSNRDRSWGPRRMRNNPRANFPWAVASETSGFQLISISKEDPLTDPFIGTTEHIVSGWYLKDGVYGELSAGEFRVLDRGADGSPQQVACRATDSLGRELVARGRMKNQLNWHGYPWLFMWWQQYEWEFDGQVAIGENQEYLPLQTARRMSRILAKTS